MTASPEDRRYLESLHDDSVPLPEGAEEELRLVFGLVAETMLREAPGLFQDFRREEDGAWVPEHRKV